MNQIRRKQAIINTVVGLIFHSAIHKSCKNYIFTINSLKKIHWTLISKESIVVNPFVEKRP